jgi:ATP-dependent DNA helicase RecQ
MIHSNKNVFNTALNKVSNQYFGGLVLKPEQIAAISEIFLNGCDVFALLPTGFGKSVIYALLPVLCDEVSGIKGKHKIIVISPLIALMEDQIASFQRVNIRAIHLTANSLQEGKCFDNVIHMQDLLIIYQQYVIDRHAI